LKEIDMTAKPLSLRASTALFLIPGLITGLLFIFGRDYLMGLGYSGLAAFLIIGCISFGMLFPISAWMYTAEGNAWSWTAMRKRLRITKLTAGQWWATFFVFLFVLGTYLGLLALGTREWIAEYIPVPDWYRDSGGSIEGMYWLIWARLGLLVLNVMGEEILWRGLILPRQEAAHGRWAWLIHGVQWTLYHAWKPWELLMLLPGCIAYAILGQWTKSTTPGIVIHFAFNGIAVVIVTLMVFGIVG
jgi:membrane protease YdiL (CAAX protease family)